MRTIIAGGRNYDYNDLDFSAISRIHKGFEITTVLCGGAKGADEMGKIWAERNNVPVEMFLANWSLYGKSAGPRRNSKMAACADACILFPGGWGTEDMWIKARKHNLIIFDFTRQLK